MMSGFWYSGNLCGCERALLHAIEMIYRKLGRPNTGRLIVLEQKTMRSYGAGATLDFPGGPGENCADAKAEVLIQHEELPWTGGHDEYGPGGKWLGGLAVGPDRDYIVAFSGLPEKDDMKVTATVAIFLANTFLLGKPGMKEWLEKTRATETWAPAFAVAEEAWAESLDFEG